MTQEQLIAWLIMQKAIFKEKSLTQSEFYSYDQGVTDAYDSVLETLGVM